MVRSIMRRASCTGLFVAWSLTRFFPSALGSDDIAYKKATRLLSGEGGNATLTLADSLLLDINSTDISCAPNVFSGLRCTTETRVTAPDGEYADLAITVDCEHKTVTDFRSNSNCSCSVVVTDDQGQIKDGCTCEICGLECGTSPVRLDCRDEYVVAECSSLDCDYGCNGPSEPDCSPNIVDGTNGSENETDTLDPPTQLNVTATAAPTMLQSIMNGTGNTPTASPTGINGTLPGENETETAAPTLSPSFVDDTFVGGNESMAPTNELNETEPGAPTMSPSFINGTNENVPPTMGPNLTETEVPTLSPSVTNNTVPADNETWAPTIEFNEHETAVPTLSPNMTIPDTNDTETMFPTSSPSALDGTGSKIDTVAPTASLNSTLPDINDTETATPTSSPSGVNGTDNETDTIPPTASPDMTLPDTNETGTAAPTLSPTNINATVNENGTTAPTSSPNMTLPGVNNTETAVPTLSPTDNNVTGNERETMTPTTSPNTTLPDANTTETATPTLSPTGINGTMTRINETQTSAPTAYPNISLPDANDTETTQPTPSPTAVNGTDSETETSAPTETMNGTETNSPTITPNSTFLDTEENANTSFTAAPSTALSPESDDSGTLAPSMTPNVSLSGLPTPSPSRVETSSPGSNVKETGAPVTPPNTAQKPSPSTSPPTISASEVQVFEFTGISMRLTGVGLTPLTPAAETVFELVTENFYRNAYQSTTTRRRLQNVKSFDTDVTVVRDGIDSTGNTIIYDQSLRFTAQAGSLDRIAAKDILLVPLSGNELRRVYLQALKDRNEEFEGVTAVNTPSLPTQNRTVGEDANGMDTLLLIFIIVGGILLCCSCCIAVALVRRCHGNGENAIQGTGVSDESLRQDDDLDGDYNYDDPNIGANRLKDPFIDEIGRVADTHERSDHSADDFFLDPSENVGEGLDREDDHFDDEIENKRRRNDGRIFGLGGVSRRQAGDSNASDDDSRSGSSSGLGSTDDYGSESGSYSESDTGSYSSSSSDDGLSFQGSVPSMNTSDLDIA